MSVAVLNSLSTRIVSALGGLALTGAIALVSVGHLQLRDLVYEQESAQGLAIAELLQAAIESDLDETPPAGTTSDIERLVHGIGQRGHLQNVFVTRPDGSLVARSAAVDRPLMYSAQVETVLRDARIVSNQDRQREILSFVVPIASDAAPREPELVLMFERNVSAALDTIRRDTVARSAAALLVALLLAAAAVQLLRNSVIRPTAALARQADALGHGDLTARSGLSPQSTGRSEMQALAAAFDTMADRLQELETQRLAADVSLRASEARYRAMVEASDDLICRALPDGRLTFVNDACCRHFQMSREELLGKSFAQLLLPSAREQMRDVLGKLEREGAAAFEQSTREATGAVRWYHWWKRAVRDSEGGLLEYQAVGRDITALKAAEEALQAVNLDLENRVRQRTGDLEIAVRELESFSYSIAHDLRAPLRSIDGFCQLLAERLGPLVDVESGQLLARVRRRAQDMGMLIDSLLTLAHVARADLDRARVDLSAVAEECVNALRRGDPQRQVEIVIQPGMEASADAGLLRIALAQLLENAWKFTRNVDQPRIEVGVTRKLNQAVAYVRDNGVGFDMAYVERLFTAFRRLHSSGETSGSGIGLAIVQRVVKRHGGQLWAEGAPGKGATFYFTLAGA